MKTNWPAYRLACLLLVSLAILASPAGARPGPPSPLVRVDTQVSANSVRIEVKANGPFDYTAARPNDHLVVVDLVGLTSHEPINARVLQSDLVSSYRVLPYGAGENAGVRLEILLRSPVAPRLERRGADQLALVFEGKVAPVSARVRPPAARAASTAAGTLIAQVAVARAGQQTSVRVEGNGPLVYHAERLNNPERLVLDFNGARLALTQTSIPSELKPVRGVRLSQFKPDVARVVIDLERAVHYTVRTDGKGITVDFATPTAAPVTTPVAANAPAWRGARPAAARPAAVPVVPNLPAMPLPAWLTQQRAMLGSLAASAEPAPPRPTDDPPPVKAPAQALTQTAPAAPAAPQAGGKYSGEPISVNLKDVDLKDFFRLIHEISGLNVVLDPAVKGTLTIVLDEVPWDQALDLVLRNNNLDKQLDGNVLRVATQETMKKEAETKRDLAKAQAEAVEQVTTTRVLSYAKASAMKDTLKRFLSARGDLIADERSNTLIIKDIPSVLPAIDNLIRQLDRKGQQVEIEARVVAASRSFARDIGTQFGFATTSTGGRTVFGGLTGQSGFTSPVIHPGPPLVPNPPLVVSGTNSIPLNTNLAAQAPTSGVTFAHSSPNFAVDFIITAAESKGVGKLLSKPKVITQNNEKATVKQGTKIPVQTTINNTVSVQFIDAVLKLEVTPQITAEGTVFMDVVVENTQIDAGIPRVQGIPALDTQSVEAKVVINDGGTVVIGGVIISSQRTDISQVPLFGSIPLIGHLFKRTNVNVQSQELLFFLTPRIVPS
ncbi:MAG: type IV pilus secretin PilQ [Acidobacteria bacterium]|nr:type IV pilus secretin PilQ [Acidobacteriota bacterium]